MKYNRIILSFIFIMFTFSSTETLRAMAVLPVITIKGSILINNNALYTNSSKVNLTLSASTSDNSSVGLMKISNKNVSDWSTVPTLRYVTLYKDWSLLSGDSVKMVYVKFGDSLGNWSEVYSSKIILDTIAPTGSITIINNSNANPPSATLILSANDVNGVKQMRFSNDNLTWSAWENYAQQKKEWGLANNGETKTVYVQFKDVAENISLFNNSITIQPPITINSSDLIAHYNFNTNFEDISGNGLNGIARNKIGFNFMTNGNFYAEFNGNDQYIEIPYVPKLNLYAMTISFWVKPDYADYSGKKFSIISKGGKDSPDFNLELSGYSQGFGISPSTQGSIAPINAPSNLDAQFGGDGKHLVYLSWKDNSRNEEEFIVEINDQALIHVLANRQETTVALDPGKSIYDVKLYAQTKEGIKSDRISIQIKVEGEVDVLSPENTIITFIPRDHKWHHVVQTRDQLKGYNFYIDGKLIRAGFSAMGFNNSANPLLIGTVNPPQEVASKLTTAEGISTISWIAQPGENYKVQYQEEINPWVNLEDKVSAHVVTVKRSTTLFPNAEQVSSNSDSEGTPILANTMCTITNANSIQGKDWDVNTSKQVNYWQVTCADFKKTTGWISETALNSVALSQVDSSQLTSQRIYRVLRLDPQAFKGGLDELMIYNRALNDVEISNLYVKQRNQFRPINHNFIGINYFDNLPEPDYSNAMNDLEILSKKYDRNFKVLLPDDINAPDNADLYFQQRFKGQIRSYTAQLQILEKNKLLRGKTAAQIIDLYKPIWQQQQMNNAWFHQPYSPNSQLKETKGKPAESQDSLDEFYMCNHETSACNCSGSTQYEGESPIPPLVQSGQALEIPDPKLFRVSPYSLKFVTAGTYHENEDLTPACDNLKSFRKEFEIYIDKPVEVFEGTTDLLGASVNPFAQRMLWESKSSYYRIGHVIDYNDDFISKTANQTTAFSIPNQLANTHKIILPAYSGVAEYTFRDTSSFRAPNAKKVFIKGFQEVTMNHLLPSLQDGPLGEFIQGELGAGLPKEGGIVTFNLVQRIGELLTAQGLFEKAQSSGAFFTSFINPELTIDLDSLGRLKIRAYLLDPIKSKLIKVKGPDSIGGSLDYCVQFDIYSSRCVLFVGVDFREELGARIGFEITAIRKKSTE